MNAKLGVVLLDQLNRYVVNERLPSRPDFDKEFLVNICKDRHILTSENTLKTLPKSITGIIRHLSIECETEYEVNLGIKTFKEFPPDIFFISRTPKYEPVQFRSKNDKYFDIEWLKANYDIVINHHNLEIWLKK